MGKFNRAWPAYNRLCPDEKVNFSSSLQRLTHFQLDKLLAALKLWRLANKKTSTPEVFLSRSDTRESRVTQTFERHQHKSKTPVDISHDKASSRYSKFMILNASNKLDVSQKKKINGEKMGVHSRSWLGRHLGAKKSWFSKLFFKFPKLSRDCSGAFVLVSSNWRK